MSLVKWLWVRPTQKFNYISISNQLTIGNWNLKHDAMLNHSKIFKYKSIKTCAGYVFLKLQNVNQKNQRRPK